MQIGGGNLAEKAAALHFLVSKCDGLIFVGSMAFQILLALGVPVPVKSVDLGALKEAASIVESAKSRNIQLLLPIDIRCIKDHISEKMEIFPVDSILEGNFMTRYTTLFLWVVGVVGGKGTLF